MVALGAVVSLTGGNPIYQMIYDNAVGYVCHACHVLCQRRQVLPAALGLCVRVNRRLVRHANWFETCFEVEANSDSTGAGTARHW